MSKRFFLIIACLFSLFLTSCKVEFSPNAPWRDVPDVYCVIDPEEDTVWARVQRCFLGEDNLYNYVPIPDSNYYAPNDISLHLLVWKGRIENGSQLVSTGQLVDRWQFVYTEREGKPDVDADFYVSAKGDDSNDGSFAHPFRTVSRAALAVRGTDKAGKERVTVAIRQGTYGLFDFDLTPADSGTAGCPCA